MDDPFRELDLFHGEATERAAQVFARLPHLPGASSNEFKLTGELVGPFCKHATTLTARYRLTDAGPGPTLLARGLVREPSYWSPELPMLYRATIRLERAGEAIAHCERPFALRRLGARGKDLYWEGRRWVLRGMCDESVVVPHQNYEAEWRELGAVKYTTFFDPAHFRVASEEGVVVLPWFRIRPTAVEARQCAQHAAIAIAPLAVKAEGAAEAFQQYAPNVLRAAMLSAPDQMEPPSWAQIAIVHSQSLHERVPKDRELAAIGDYAAHLSLPVIAVRNLSQPHGLPKARAAVDELQRDLAPYGDFAGYLV